MALLDEYMPADMPTGEIDPRELEKARYLAMMRLGLGMAGREPLGSSASGAIKAYALAQGNARQNMLAQLQAYKTRQEIGAKAKGEQRSELLRGDMKDIFGGRIAAPGGPTNANAEIASNATLAAIAQYRQVAARLAQEGKFEDAKRMSDVADGMEEQYFPQVEVKTPEGQVRMAQFGRRGGERVSGLAPAKPLHFTSTGGMAGVGQDPYSGKVEFGGLPVTMDPAQRDTSARGWAQLKQSDRHHQDTQNAGQVVTGEGGIFRVPRVGEATPVVVAGGEQLRAPIPAATKEKIAQNNVNIRLTAEAIALVKRNKSAFGPGNIVGDFITQRTDPTGVPARAAVANLGSLKFHDRSGANITASESPRLTPFIPAATDEPETIVTKLEGFQRESILMNQELASGKGITDVAGLANTVPPDVQEILDRAKKAKGAP